MRTRFTLTLAMILALIGLPSLHAREKPVKKPLNTETAAFCIDLYKQLAAEKGNHFFSPFSIVTALAMTSAGAAGQTDAEMAQVLHLDPDPAKRHVECASWARSLNTARSFLFKRPSGGLEISTANALWCAHGVSFKNDFIKIATKDYDAEVKSLDFARKPGEAVDKINDWVDDKTRSKIKKILTPDAVNRDTALVLTNAIYFKGDWSSKFEKEATRDADFTLDGGTKINCNMMGQTATLNYAKLANFAALEMPYKGGRMTMLILLPNALDGLANLEKDLTATLLDDAIKALTWQKVVVYLPKFHAETRYSVGDHLQKMGMRRAFLRSDADFSGITDDPPLFISAVIHKAFVDVDEEGTEAAAATAITMEVASAVQRKDPPVFRADHPFVYFIRDTETGQILFAGRMADPR